MTDPRKNCSLGSGASYTYEKSGRANTPSFPAGVPPDPDCPICLGSGAADSGGATPWGAAIEVRCGCTYPRDRPAIK